MQSKTTTTTICSASFADFLLHHLENHREVTETKPQISLGLNIVEKERESLAIS